MVFKRRDPPEIWGAFASRLITMSALTRVMKIDAFGSNPGGLEMYAYAPAGLRAGRPLVVVLHGCGQNAANFAAESGWIKLALQYRLALLLPQQTYRNNM